MRNKCILAFIMILVAIIALAILKRGTVIDDKAAHVLREDIKQAVIQYTGYLKAGNIEPYSSYFRSIDKRTSTMLIKDITDTIFENNVKSKLLLQINQEVKDYENILMDFKEQSLNNNSAAFNSSIQYRNIIKNANLLDARLHVLVSYYNNYFKEDYKVILPLEVIGVANEIIKKNKSNSYTR